MINEQKLFSKINHTMQSCGITSNQLTKVDEALAWYQTEGYVEPNNTDGFKYVYQYKDHLGNIRLSYADSDNNGTITQNEIIEENNYYPFGLEHKGYNNVVNGTEHPYKYNGMEHQEELGLDWYDYGARNYDPALGRWMNIDPLAETSRRWSPYNYVYNNPLRFIDPDGMQADDITIMDNGSITREETDDNFDIVQNESGDKKIQIDHKDGKSQIGDLQEISLTDSKGNEATTQYMLIEDNDVAKQVFEFAASTTANSSSNAEFGLDMFSFEDGFSTNLFQTGEISAKGFPNVKPLGQLDNLDLGNGHLVKNSTWIENNHSHSGAILGSPSGFLRRYGKNGTYFEPAGSGDRTFVGVGSKSPTKQYMYSSHEKTYIEYNSKSAKIIGNRKK